MGRRPPRDPGDAALILEGLCTELGDLLFHLEGDRSVQATHAEPADEIFQHGPHRPCAAHSIGHAPTEYFHVTSV